MTLRMPCHRSWYRRVDDVSPQFYHSIDYAHSPPVQSGCRGLRLRSHGKPRTLRCRTELRVAVGRSTSDRSRRLFAMRPQSIGVGRICRYGARVATVAPHMTKMTGRKSANGPYRCRKRLHWPHFSPFDHAFLDIVPQSAHSYGPQSQACGARHHPSPERYARAPRSWVVSRRRASALSRRTSAGRCNPLAATVAAGSVRDERPWAVATSTPNS